MKDFVIFGKKINRDVLSVQVAMFFFTIGKCQDQSSISSFGIKYKYAMFVISCSHSVCNGVPLFNLTNARNWAHVFGHFFDYRIVDGFFIYGQSGCR